LHIMICSFSQQFVASLLYWMETCTLIFIYTWCTTDRAWQDFYTELYLHSFVHA
jgi:hypothetical protein